MARRTVTALLALSLCAGLPAASASAQNGVTFDSDSPTGKEYAVPLTSAREEASSGRDDAPAPSSSGTGTTSSAPLFGEGIGDDASGRSSDSPKSSGGGKSQASTRRSDDELAARGKGSSQVDRALDSTRPVAATVPQGGVGSTLTILAVAVSVLLLGGVIGSVARRRSS